MEYKPVWPTTARDFCSITATRHVKGDTYAMSVKTVCIVRFYDILEPEAIELDNEII